jgi:hypothetical protein
MVARVNLVINVTVASLAMGAATLLFARHFGVDGLDNPWRRAYRRWLVLAFIALLSTGLVVTAAQLVRLIPRDVLAEHRVVRWGWRGLELAIFVVLQCSFAYATAWIVLRGHRAWPALRDSCRVAARTFLPTAIVIGLPAALLYPMSYLTSRVDVVASRFRPEVVVGMLAVQLVLELLAMIVVSGAITRLFLWRMEAAR